MTSTTTARTESDVWVEKARALAPIIEKHRDDGERDRHLPGPIFEAMMEAGLYRMYLARSLGGPQAELIPSLLAYEEVARHDAVAAWNFMIGSQGGLFADYLTEDVARSIFGGDRVLGAGSFSPTGQAIVVPGGYLVSGRWSFASGCHHATWFVCGCIVIDGGQPRMREEGPDIQIMLLPASEGMILDTWHSGGLRGTGSHDIEVKDVFVPEGRHFSFAELLAGPKSRPGVGYSQPFLLMASVGMAALALGIARDALDSFKALATEKTPSGSRSKLATQPVVQDAFADATALVGSSRTYFFEAAECLAASEHPGEDVAAQIRLAGAHTVRSCQRAVETVYNLAGGTSVYSSSRLDRCFRDLHIVSHHVAVSPTHFELVGEYLLGGALRSRR